MTEQANVKSCDHLREINFRLPSPVCGHFLLAWCQSLFRIDFFSSKFCQIFLFFYSVARVSNGGLGVLLTKVLTSVIKIIAATSPSASWIKVIVITNWVKGQELMRHRDEHSNWLWWFLIVETQLMNLIAINLANLCEIFCCRAQELFLWLFCFWAMQCSNKEKDN